MAPAENDQYPFGMVKFGGVETTGMEVRDLFYDIEDCMDRIRCFSECWDGDLSYDNKVFVEDVQELKSLLMEARRWRMAGYKVKGWQYYAAAASSTYVPAVMNAAVGIGEPKEDLRELLIDGGTGQLSVISIVGFSGSGKTTLAKAVYEDVASKFDCRAWVVASNCKDQKELLEALQKELLFGGKEDQGNGDVQTKIKDKLCINRYLVVIDDIQEGQWLRIKSLFPNGNLGSRILVTTTSRQVAALCRNHSKNGYVYNMKTLDERHSKALLKVVFGHSKPFEAVKLNLDFDLDFYLATGLSLKQLVDKCDGHPVALVCVANYLKSIPKFTETECNNFWNEICDHMEEIYFKDLRRVVVNSYSSLPSNLVNLKACLLYTCVFPNGHPINRNRLIRRWLAEGYVQDSDPFEARRRADENFEKLIDRNIIRPIQLGKNRKVKTCRAQGIMHEFMLHMSRARTSRFIASLDDEASNSYRHLTWHSSSGSGRKLANENEDMRAHSLTICGSVGSAVADIPKYEFLRVLDLEECDDLVNKYIADITELWHLRYLSLGPRMSVLPEDIKKLHCLQILDTRKTKTEITLPMEVLKLHQLAQLLGKFKLGAAGDWKEIRSNLHTLSGFVTDDQNPGFQLLMPRMENLRKVKIWCNVSDESYSMDLSDAIKKFLQEPLRTGSNDRSLSLDLGKASQNILSSLNHSTQMSRDLFIDIPIGCLGSLKLHGELSGFTEFATLLSGLKELCLSSTNGMTINELENLCILIKLEYLKLVAIELDGFVIRNRDFPILSCLCLVQCPSLPQIEEGAMSRLVSLQLLDQHLEGLSGIKIELHENLQELALDSDVQPETITIWEDAAKKHPNRPRVLFFEVVAPNEWSSMVKYVPVERPQFNMGSSVEGLSSASNDLPSSTVMSRRSVKRKHSA